jgi:uncharacterized protein YqgQ
MKRAIKPASFWITNISPRNVTLADLATNIKAFTSVNLLDDRHYAYTMEQLEKSMKSGSIFKKKDIIKVRDIPPVIEKKQWTETDEKSSMPTRAKSILEIKEQDYLENVSGDSNPEEQKKFDEQLARTNADLEDED